MIWKITKFEATPVTILLDLEMRPAKDAPVWEVVQTTVPWNTTRELVEPLIQDLVTLSQRRYDNIQRALHDAEKQAAIALKNGTSLVGLTGETILE